MRRTTILAAAALLLAVAPDGRTAGSSGPANGLSASQDYQVTARQADFLRSLQTASYEEAYQRLLADSPILTEEPNRVAALVAETRRKIELSGGMTDWENHDPYYQDRHLIYRAATVCCAKRPLFFYFVWYRSIWNAGWFVTQIWFDDQAKEFMERYPYAIPQQAGAPPTSGSGPGGGAPPS